jgi:protein TonB
VATTTPTQTLHTTANTVFKARYQRYIRNSIIWAFVIHVLVFVLSPEFTFKPYKLREERFEVVEIPDNIEIPPPPQEIQQPQVDIQAAEDDEATEDEIAPTTFDSFEDMPPPPPPSGQGSEVFLAFDEPPVLIDYVSPGYPALAREAGIEGTVSIRVLVNEEGKVIAADVLQSDVTEAMARAAVEAAKKCRFRPAKQRTIPVKAHVMIPFHFQLH